tara:strand:- start:3468 stop:4097 length:630 start_codon:yes stop_codon:yes gene_type:complete
MKNQLVEIIEKYNMNGFNGRYDSQGRHLGGWGTDKDTEHGYCDFYVENLEKYKDKDVSVLELGTNYGCSAILWHDYLTKSRLLLLDIQETMNPKCWEIMDNKRFMYANCDAYDEDTPAEVKKVRPEGFDIIFDDGPHTLESQELCIEYYLPMLKEGGTLFIEDVQRVEDFEALDKKLEEVGGDRYVGRGVDLRHLKNRYDDLIFAITFK